LQAFSFITANKKCGTVAGIPSTIMVKKNKKINEVFCSSKKIFVCDL